MKASSPVLDSVQRPATVLGLPPVMAAATATAAAAVLGVLNFVVAWPLASGICFAAVLVGGLAVSWRLKARDPHVEEVWKNGLGFWHKRHGWRLWRGWKKDDCRVLCAGGPE